MSKQQRGKVNAPQDSSDFSINLPDIPPLDDSELKFDSHEEYDTLFNKYNKLFLQHCDAVDQINARRYILIDILDKIQNAYDDHGEFAENNSKSDDDSDEKLIEVLKKPSAKIPVKNINDEQIKKKKLGEPKADREAKKKVKNKKAETNEEENDEENEEAEAENKKDKKAKKAKEVKEVKEVKKKAMIESEPEKVEEKKKVKNKKNKD
jgi:hypothetical protein